MATFKDIPQFIQAGSYQVDIPLRMIPDKIREWENELDLQLNPDFQRGHVWTEEQQIAFMEFVLRGGESGRIIYFNHPGWMGSFKGDFVCVDGLQRLTAICRFFNNEIPVFGHFYNEFEDRLNTLNSMKFNVNKLKTKREVLRWYLEMNTGGTPHTKKEIERVRNMMEEL